MSLGAVVGVHGEAKTCERRLLERFAETRPRYRRPRAYS
jgi:hypothetical protein